MGRSFKAQLIEWVRLFQEFIAKNTIVKRPGQRKGKRETFSSLFKKGLPSASQIASFLNDYTTDGDEERNVEDRDAERIPQIPLSALEGREAEIMAWLQLRLTEYHIEELGPETFFMVSQFRKKPQVCTNYKEAEAHMMTRINNRFRDHFLRTPGSLAKKIAKVNR